VPSGKRCLSHCGTTSRLRSKNSSTSFRTRISFSTYGSRSPASVACTRITAAAAAATQFRQGFVPFILHYVRTGTAPTGTRARCGMCVWYQRDATHSTAQHAVCGAVRRRRHSRAYTVRSAVGVLGVLTPGHFRPSHALSCGDVFCDRLICCAWADGRRPAGDDAQADGACGWCVQYSLNS
jgi:hypothetical protein